MESFKETYDRIKNSQEFKRNSYVRRMTGVLVIVFGSLLMMLAFLVEKIFGISGYITCSIAGIAATTLAVFVAEKKGDKIQGENMNRSRSSFIEQMPSLEKRRKDALFKAIAFKMRMLPENDLHWLLYTAYKTCFIFSFIFAIFTVNKLALIDGLTERDVIRNLKFFTMGVSFPMYLIIVPYYLLKIIKIIGFSKIDFMEAFVSDKFPRKVVRDGWTSNRKKIIRKSKLVCITVSIASFFGWMTIVNILKHYDALLSILSISFWLILYIFLHTIMISPVFITMFLIWRQYSHHYQEIPSSLTAHEGS